jgi:hypothetical protein
MLFYAITVTTTLQTGQVVRREQYAGLMTQEICESEARRIERAQSDTTATCHADKENK